jgi:hypothetical protein
MPQLSLRAPIADAFLAYALETRGNQELEAITFEYIQKGIALIEADDNFSSLVDLMEDQFKGATNKKCHYFELISLGPIYSKMKGKRPFSSRRDMAREAILAFCASAGLITIIDRRMTVQGAIKPTVTKLAVPRRRK